MIEQCGIYFLFKGKKIVYIGQSKQAFTRVKQHHANLMDYDNIRFVPCEPSALSDYENYCIRKFKPLYNVRGVPKITYKRKVILIKKHMRFRKLTRKSTLGFGSHREWTVGDLIDRGRYFTIIDSYFNLSHITFFDDVLDEVKISKEWRIEKPGVDKYKGYDFKTQVWPEERELRKMIGDKRERAISMEALSNINKISRSKAYGKTMTQNLGFKSPI